MTQRTPAARSSFVLAIATLTLCCSWLGCKPANPEAPAGSSATTDTDDEMSVVPAPPAEESATLAAPTEEAATDDAPADEAPAEVEEETAEPSSSAKVLLGTPELTAGIPGEGPLTVEEISAWLAEPRNMEVLEIELPVGLDKGLSQVKGLDENPLTRAKIELGRQLYFDRRLSSDATISCADCHHPDDGYARHTQFGIGVGGQQGGRNSPISYNRILSDAQFWDGRAASLEEQAVGPIANPIEMSNTHENCCTTVGNIPGYKHQFEEIFGGVSIDAIGQALASFERAIVTGPSPFDYQEKLKAFEGIDPEELKEDDPELYAAYERAVADAEAHPMSESAKRGMAIYFSEKGNCSACHVGPNLTDEQYYNIGVGMAAETPDLGRYEITKEDKDRGAFKTPTIRNVEHTAPYMHDGSVQTLEEVVEFYVKGGEPNPYLHERIKKLDLTDQDKKDLVEFMKACSGPFPTVETARLPADAPAASN